MPLQRKRVVQPVPPALPLFREEALAARREPLHGAVTALLPPGAPAAALLAMAALGLLAFAAWLVEVPQRTPAVGVLMPPGGFVRVVAARSGRVTALHVREGERVDEGQDLVVVTADEGAVGEDSVPQARLASLHAELALQRDLAQAQRAAKDARARMLDERIRGVSVELDRVATEIGLQEVRVDLLARRLQRVQSLMSGGNAADAQLEEARLDWLAARAAVASLQRQSVRIEREGEQVREARAALSLEAAQREIEQGIAAERLGRELPEVEAHVGQVLRAPRAGVIARLMVHPGQPVAAGDTLATIQRSVGGLEAWLYVPSSRAGSLRAGQPVALRFEAWPSRIFGTQPATIETVSAIALMPSDLDVPLTLPGPVFEIRAKLERQSLTAGGRRWPLAAGTAVRADLVQQRYRLFEWLFRLARDPESAAPEPGDA